MWVNRRKKLSPRWVIVHGGQLVGQGGRVGGPHEQACNDYLQEKTCWNYADIALLVFWIVGKVQ